MVAGDLVNTASRVQSAAEPGTVLVGESTKRASEAAIAYEDAGSHELKGKTGADAALAGGPRGGRDAGSDEIVRSRGALRRPRPRAAPRQGALPRLRRRAEGTARLGHGHRRHRQVAPVLGVREVHRRPRRRRLLAPRPLPLLRRGSRLLGARRDGADALRHRRGRGAGLRAREAARDGRGAHPRPGGAPLGRAAACSPARARRGSRPATRRTSSRPGGSSSSGSPSTGRRSSSSRTCSGPTRACSTSSSTCSSGREATRSTCSSSPAPNSPTSVLPGAPASATSPRCTSSRCRSSPWATC